MLDYFVQCHQTLEPALLGLGAVAVAVAVAVVVVRCVGMQDHYIDIVSAIITTTTVIAGMSTVSSLDDVRQCDLGWMRRSRCS